MFLRSIFYFHLISLFVYKTEYVNIQYQQEKRQLLEESTVIKPLPYLKL